MKNNPLEHRHSAAHFFKYKYQANCSIGPSHLILSALYRRRGWGFTASRQTLNEVAALQNYPIDTQHWSNVLDVESTLNWRYFNAVCLLGNLKKCGWVSPLRIQKKNNDEFCLNKTVTGDCKHTCFVGPVWSCGHLDREERISCCVSQWFVMYVLSVVVCLFSLLVSLVGYVLWL